MFRLILILLCCMPGLALAHVFDGADCNGIAIVSYTISSMFHEDGSEANHQRVLRMVDRSIRQNMGSPTSFIADDEDGAKLHAIADLAYEHRDVDPQQFANVILDACMKHANDKAI